MADQRSKANVSSLSWSDPEILTVCDQLCPGERTDCSIRIDANYQRRGGGHQRRQEQQPGGFAPAPRRDMFVRPCIRPLAKPCPEYDGQKIRGIEQARCPQHPDHPRHMRHRGALYQPCLAYRPGGQRRAHHAQCGDAERQGGQRHAPSGAVHLAYLVNAQRLGVVAGAEEQRDLHDALMHEVGKSSDGADGAEQGDAECDVGDLADGGKGQPLFEVILEQRAQTTPDDGHGRSDGKRREQIK